MKNEYKITKQEMLSWAKEYHLQGAANVALFILWSFIGVIGLALVVVYSVCGGDWLDWYLAILFLLLSIFKLFFSRFVALSNRYKLFSKTYGVTEWIRATEFTDEEITVYDHTSVTKFRYENIKKIKEKGNVIMIFFDHNLALRLYKNTFTEGSWDECKEKLQSLSKAK